MKLALGFTIALLMSLHHVSAQTLLSTTVLPDTEVNSTMALEEDQGAPSGSGLEPNSGDDLQTVNVTSAEPPVVLVTGTPDDENVTTVSSAFIPFDSNEFNSTDYNSSDPLWPEPSPSAPNMTDVSQSNGTETPLSNSTTVATVSGNLTTTRSPRPGNSTTMSPTNYNSTKTTRPTTVIPSNASVPVTGSDDNKPATEFVTDVNVTGSFIAGEEAGRGLLSNTDNQHKSQAWGVFLGVTIAVAIAGMVIYVIQKRRSYRDFSHRKLVEDVPQDPVLRLDNSEPLDLKHGGFAYYNPGLQGDNIQMTNFPQGQYN